MSDSRSFHEHQIASSSFLLYATLSPDSPRLPRASPLVPHALDRSNDCRFEPVGSGSHRLHFESVWLRLRSPLRLCQASACISGPHCAPPHTSTRKFAWCNQITAVAFAYPPEISKNGSNESCSDPNTSLSNSCSPTVRIPVNPSTRCLSTILFCSFSCATLAEPFVARRSPSSLNFAPN